MPDHKRDGHFVDRASQASIVASVLLDLVLGVLSGRAGKVKQGELREYLSWSWKLQSNWLDRSLLGTFPVEKMAGSNLEAILKRPSSAPAKALPDVWITPQFSWAYAVFIAAIIAQALTVVITWEVWKDRSFPVNLPMLYTQTFPPIAWFEFDYTWLMLGSLGLAAFFPKWGTWTHIAVFAVACVVDQFRQQPQFFFLVTMMFLLSRNDGKIAARWLLIALWIWAGLHKLLSTEWLGFNAAISLDRMEWTDESMTLPFAYGVALTELGVGLMALFWRWLPAIAAASMHIGIAIFLSPVGINHNSSVIPWNLFVAIAAVYILITSCPKFPVPWPGRVFAIVVLTAPTLFYVNALDHGLSFVLYSGMMPYGRITSSAIPPESDPVHGQINGWLQLEVPFPNERRTLIQYFDMVAAEGSKMHLHDPRWGLPDRYLLKTRSGVIDLSESAFFEAQKNAPAGQAYADRTCIYHLTSRNTELLSRYEGGPIYAARLSAADFDASLISSLGGLPNLEQIQFANCVLTDEHLERMPRLPNLVGIGLSGTLVTDRGLESLRKYSKLQVIEFEGTAISGRGLQEIGFDTTGTRLIN